MDDARNKQGLANLPNKAMGMDYKGALPSLNLDVVGVAVVALGTPRIVFVARLFSLSSLCSRHLQYSHGCTKKRVDRPFALVCMDGVMRKHRVI